MRSPTMRSALICNCRSPRRPWDNGVELILIHKGSVSSSFPTLYDLFMLTTPKASFIQYIGIADRGEPAPQPVIPIKPRMSGDDDSDGEVFYDASSGEDDDDQATDAPPPATPPASAPPPSSPAPPPVEAPAVAAPPATPEAPVVVAPQPTAPTPTPTTTYAHDVDSNDGGGEEGVGVSANVNANVNVNVDVGAAANMRTAVEVAPPTPIVVAVVVGATTASTTLGSARGCAATPTDGVDSGSAAGADGAAVSACADANTCGSDAGGGSGLVIGTAEEDTEPGVIEAEPVGGTGAGLGNDSAAGAAADSAVAELGVALGAVEPHVLKEGQVEKKDPLVGVSVGDQQGTVGLVNVGGEAATLAEVKKPAQDTLVVEEKEIVQLEGSHESEGSIPRIGHDEPAVDVGLDAVTPVDTSILAVDDILPHVTSNDNFPSTSPNQEPGSDPSEKHSPSDSLNGIVEEHQKMTPFSIPTADSYDPNPLTTPSFIPSLSSAQGNSSGLSLAKRRSDTQGESSAIGTETKTSTDDATQVYTAPALIDVTAVSGSASSSKALADIHVIPPTSLYPKLESAPNPVLPPKSEIGSLLISEPKQFTIIPQTNTCQDRSSMPNLQQDPKSSAAETHDNEPHTDAHNTPPSLGEHSLGVDLSQTSKKIEGSPTAQHTPPEPKEPTENITLLELPDSPFELLTAVSLISAQEPPSDQLGKPGVLSAYPITTENQVVSNDKPTHTSRISDMCIPTPTLYDPLWSLPPSQTPTQSDKAVSTATALSTPPTNEDIKAKAGGESPGVSSQAQIDCTTGDQGKPTAVTLGPENTGNSNTKILSSCVIPDYCDKFNWETEWILTDPDEYEIDMNAQQQPGDGWLKWLTGTIVSIPVSSWKAVTSLGFSVAGLMKSLILSSEMEDACKKIWAICCKYFQDIPPMDLFMGILLLSAYYNGNPSPPESIKEVTDPEYATLVADMMLHASGSYGWKLMGGFMTNFVEGTKVPASTIAPLLANNKKANLDALRKHTGLLPSDIYSQQWESTRFSPGHYCAVDHERQCIVVSIRGTWGLHDTVSDLVAENEPFEFFGRKGNVHQGILTCARRKFEQLLPHIQQAVSDHPALPIHVVGHSLGGGVSTLLAMLLAAKHPEWRVRAFSFAPAAVLSLTLAEAPETKKIVSSFVYSDDIVPRLSYGSLEIFKGLIKQTLSHTQNNKQRFFQYMASGKLLGSYLQKKIAKMLQCSCQANFDSTMDSSSEMLQACLLPGGEVYFLDNRLPSSPLLAIKPNQDKLGHVEVGNAMPSPPPIASQIKPYVINPLLPLKSSIHPQPITAQGTTDNLPSLFASTSPSTSITPLNTHLPISITNTPLPSAVQPQPLQHSAAPFFPQPHTTVPRNTQPFPAWPSQPNVSQPLTQPLYSQPTQLTTQPQPPAQWPSMRPVTPLPPFPLPPLPPLPQIPISTQFPNTIAQQPFPQTQAHVQPFWPSTVNTAPLNVTRLPQNAPFSSAQPQVGITPINPFQMQPQVQPLNPFSLSHQSGAFPSPWNTASSQMPFPNTTFTATQPNSTFNQQSHLIPQPTFPVQPLVSDSLQGSLPSRFSSITTPTSQPLLLPSFDTKPTLTEHPQTPISSSQPQPPVSWLQPQQVQHLQTVLQSEMQKQLKQRLPLPGSTTPITASASASTSTPATTITTATTATTTAAAPAKRHPFTMVLVKNRSFAHIVISPHMFTDHLPHRYEAALNGVAENITGLVRNVDSLLDNILAGSTTVELCDMSVSTGDPHTITEETDSETTTSSEPQQPQDS
ncbi:G-protein-coupled receptor family 3 protein 5 [Pelomyxa schiedti]|nr:G-protein-coupled receptor family 3 protein 5 [Pelomyxa schiedti]